MATTAQTILAEALALSEDARLDLATELIASVDGPADSDWESTWLAELDERIRAATQRGASGSDWETVRARILERLAPR
jgi:putative addiction module component (TIGR02574 family)